MPAALSEDERPRRLSVAVADLLNLAMHLGLDAAQVHAELERQTRGRASAGTPGAESPP